MVDCCFMFVYKTTHRGNVNTFFFLGFNSMAVYNLLLFILILIIYIVTICGNLLIIMLVYYSKTLHSPMYFFLSQLSVSDIMLTTDIAPNMLNIVLHERTAISFPGCITQYYFFGSIETFECFLLTVMSYDRYLAICSPLHYASIMNHMLCIKLVFTSWLLSCAIAFILTVGICQLEFCGPNTIDHFYCDFNPLVELSCSDASRVQMELTLLCFPVIVLPFIVIVVSYASIVITMLKITSFSGKLKSFSTCISHLIVVLIFYGTLIGMYVLPNEGQSQMIKKIMSMLYTVFTPFLNPFIYSLRNKDIKEALRKPLFKAITTKCTMVPILPYHIFIIQRQYGHCSEWTFIWLSEAAQDIPPFEAPGSWERCGTVTSLPASNPFKLHHPVQFTHPEIQRGGGDETHFRTTNLDAIAGIWPMRYVEI
ncbi:PREDICTED: olfactory receptor 1468-like [Nanorana parkeri]|uniref:olfactory receptor 1468-like n=1 Tax=Nanorana parkeri TaxID=125878 RepID=UPI000854883D|nr:PREDICTED: olfactory receptor 1468-like [Nanorana parkeri]